MGVGVCCVGVCGKGGAVRDSGPSIYSLQVGVCIGVNTPNSVVKVVRIGRPGFKAGRVILRDSGE